MIARVRAVAARIAALCGRRTSVPGATRPGWTRILVAGFVSALTFAAATLGQRHLTGAPSFPEDVSDLVVPYIPADTFGRLLSDLGPHGKEIAFALSLIAAGVAVVALTLVYGALVRRGWHPVRLAVALGLLCFVGLWALFGPVLDANDAGGTLLRRRAIGALTLLATVGVSVLVAALLVVVRPRARAVGPGDRRAFLAGAAGLVGGVVLGGGALFAALRSFAGATNLDYEGNSTPATSTITPNDLHYVVSKNLVDPAVDADMWRLEVTGLVASARTLRLDDLRALPQREEIVTLQCISSGVAGGLMSTAVWRGPRLTDVVALAGAVDPRARFLILSAADGYYDSLPVDVALVSTTLVALQMNGETLPARHGFPARIVLPGRYGEKSMKWLARAELSDHDQPGFYQREGWSEEGVVRTWSRFDSIGHGSLHATVPVTIRGHAYAGTRGVDRVEVSTDGGGTWSDADLDAVVSPYAWRFFTARWTPPSAGTYHLVVRCTDGTGTLQQQAYEGYVPRGAAGWHMVDVIVNP